MSSMPSEATPTTTAATTTGDNVAAAADDDDDKFADRIDSPPFLSFDLNETTTTTTPWQQTAAVATAEDDEKEADKREAEEERASHPDRTFKRVTFVIDSSCARSLRLAKCCIEPMVEHLMTVMETTVTRAEATTTTPQLLSVKVYDIAADANVSPAPPPTRPPVAKKSLRQQAASAAANTNTNSSTNTPQQQQQQQQQKTSTLVMLFSVNECGCGCVCVC